MTLKGLSILSKYQKISIEEFSAILCLDKVYFVHWKESVAVEIDMNRHRRCSSCSF